MESSTVNISIFARFLGLSMLSRGYSVSPLKLQKLLYYQQAWHMVIFGRGASLFNETPEAWVNGPVYPGIYREYKGKVPGMCDHLKESDFGLRSDENIWDVISVLQGEIGLSRQELDLFGNVIDLYASRSQNQLIFTTHMERPWIEARGDLMPFEPSSRQISLDTMHDYYLARYNRNRNR